jgi:hypothetical protein
MAHTFPELAIGGVLLPPFVTYLAMALVVMIVLRPLLHVVRRCSVTPQSQS